MTHSPVPWIADFSTANGHFGWSIRSAGKLIATVYVDNYSSSDKIGETAANPKNAESVANAHLIEAAPQLLEALKRMRYIFETFEYTHQDDLLAAHKQASAAIAAAEGSEQ